VENERVLLIVFEEGRLLPDGLNKELNNYFGYLLNIDRLCGLVVRVLSYRSGGPGSIPGHYKKSSGSGTGSTQPREYN
jgi:hypothetical protein